MSFQVPFPQSFSQFSLSSFELGWPNPNTHLLAQCTFEDWLGKTTQSEHRAMMKVFLCYQPVPSPSWAVRQNILLDNSRTTWERLPCPVLFGALLHNLTNTQDYCNNASLNWGLSSLSGALTSSNTKRTFPSLCLWFFENVFLILQRIGEKREKGQKKWWKSTKKNYKKYGENTEKVRQKYETVSKK